jgi:hypothetical protein
MIRISGWDSDRAWTNWSGTQRTALTGRLADLADLNCSEVKRLARRILDRKCFEIHLAKAPDRFAAESVRHLLEALGAEVVVADV